MRLTRRASLLGLAAWSLGSASLALGAPSGMPAGAPALSGPGSQARRRGDPRLVVVLLRGALDGMAAVVPYGDGNLAALRARLLLPEPGQPGGLLDLGGFYGLHPALSRLHGFYRSGELLAVHATAGGYRSRSHFEAQDLLESGADQRLTSGWLNRVVGLLAARPASPSPGGSGPDGEGVALGLSVPLLLRGPARVGSFSTESRAGPSPDLYARIAALNAPDRITGPAIAEGLRARGYSERVLGDGRAGGGAFAVLASAAGKLLASADGPRVAALELGGWDTHAGQLQRLDAPLRQLDEGLGALRDGLDTAWASSVVLVMTEFGRTARANGTGGTDHGTAGVALLAGGAVAGGRVGGTWPGLASAQLFENRDLAPTTDLRALAKGVLRSHLGLEASLLQQVFPGSAAVAPSDGLLRA